MLALDGGTWDLLDGYMQRGLLPNLAKLRKGGVWGPLKSIKPSSSPVIWTTVATGKTPEKHGITFFVRFPTGNTGQPVPVSRTLRRCKAIWNILGDRDKDVAIDGWLITWPAEEVYGRMITDRAHYGNVEKESFPPGYMTELQPVPIEKVLKVMPSFMSEDFDFGHMDRNSKDPEERLNFLVYDRFVRAYARDEFYLEAAERMLDDGPLPDATFVYLRGTDDVQHGFWKFMEPDKFKGVTEEEARRFGKVIERYWQWTDQAVGKILSHFDKDTLIVVLSDHGGGPAVGKYKIITKEYLQLSGSHRNTGILIINGPGVKVGKEIDFASVYDITPTLLAYVGLPVAEDMDGRILKEAFVPGIANGSAGTIATYETGKPKPIEAAQPDKPSAVDKKVLEGLRSLGYIN